MTVEHVDEPKPGQPGYAIPNRGGDNSRFMAAKAKVDEQDARVEDAARGDRPLDIIRELQAESAKLTLRLFRKANRTQKVPERIIVEASRETRQLTDRLIDLIAAEGAAAQAETWLSDLSARVETLASGLAESAKPVTAPPA